MIIIVAVKKNTLIVSSELTVLHKHDLISPPNGAGIVNSVFQKKDLEVHCSPMPWARPHIKRGREMEPGPGLFHLGPRALCPGLGSLVWWVPWLPLWPQDWFQGFKGIRADRNANIRYPKRNNHYFSEAQPRPGFRLSNQNPPWFGPSFARLQPGRLLCLLPGQGTQVLPSWIHSGWKSYSHHIRSSAQGGVSAACMSLGSIAIHFSYCAFFGPLLLPSPKPCSRT